MSETRARLIETATDLFLGKGYGAVGTSQICSTAGVNKGTFYHFFPSKSALLIAAIEKYTKSFEDAFEQIAQSDAAAPEKLAALFEVPAAANRSWRKRNGFSQGCLLGNVIVELGTVDDAVRQASQKALRQWEKPIEPIIAEIAIFEGLHSLDTSKGARCVVSMIQGGLLLAKLNNDPGEISAMAPAALGALHTLSAKSKN